MKLRGNTFICEYSSEINNFISIKNSITGDEYIKEDIKQSIIELYGISNKNKVKLTPEKIEVSENENELVITIKKFSNKNIIYNIYIKSIEDKIITNADIENLGESIEITEALMPRTSGIYLGDNYEDDVIVYPHRAGEKTINPVVGYGKSKKNFWGASSVKFEDVYGREINYCRLASMSWMYYYDDNNGLYIGSHDERFSIAEVIAETGGQESNPWMGFGLRKYRRITNEQKYNTGNYVIAITDKDWHYGSKIYRQCIGKYLDFDHNPDYLKE